MVFEWWEYDDPYKHLGRIESREHREKLKRERKEWRNNTGCKSCARYYAALNVCSEGLTANIEKVAGVRWCKWWWDSRSKKPPVEVKKR